MSRPDPLAADRARLRNLARLIADATQIKDFTCWKVLVVAKLLNNDCLTAPRYRAEFERHVTDEIAEGLDRIGGQIGCHFDHQALPAVGDLIR